MEGETLVSRVGIGLPASEERIIRIHPSIEGLTLAERRLITEREALGSAVIRLAYLTYLYAIKRVNDKAKLSELASSFGEYAAKGLYKRYRLEDYAITGKAEKPGSTHIEMARKLVASVYRTHGFHAAYKLLQPLYGSAPQRLDSSYKTLIQQFAQARRLTPVYTTTQSGPAHELMFTCQLRVGTRTSMGTGTSKKRAESAAAKAYAERYHIPSQQGGGQHSATRKKSPHSIDRDRMSELESAASALGLPVGCLSARQFDICMTHSSYVDENPGSINNDCLKTIGSTVIEVLGFDYVEERYDPARIGLVGEKTLLLQEDSIAQAVPEKTLRALRTGKTVKGQKNTNYEALKAEIAKSVLASIFINYAASAKPEEWTSLKELANVVLDKASSNVVPDYRTIVQKIVQGNKLVYHEEYKQLSSTKSTPGLIYQAEVSVADSTWRVKRQGKGKSKHEARNEAIKAMLPALLAHCPNRSLLDSIRDELETDRRKLQKAASPEPKKERKNNAPDTPRPVGVVPNLEPPKRATAKKPSRDSSSARPKQKPITTVVSVRPDMGPIANWTVKEKRSIERSYGEHGLYAKLWGRVLENRSEYEILYAAMALGAIRPAAGPNEPTPHDMELVEYFRTHSLVDELKARRSTLSDEDVARAHSLCLYDNIKDFKWKRNQSTYGTNRGTSSKRHSATERYKPPTRGDDYFIWDNWDSYIFEQ